MLMDHKHPGLCSTQAVHPQLKDSIGDEIIGLSGDSN
jgi:hypothetical protein